VFPTDFDLPLLITIYAMVILGGAGSLAGVVLGAIVINVSLEALTDPEHARWLFYGVILVSLVAALRPWRRLAAVLGALVASGFVLHVIVDAASSRWTAGDGAGDDVVARAVDSWVLLPSDPKQIGNIAFVGLVAAVLALTLARGVWRLVGLVPVLYLAAFVWENRLAAEPSVTRLILLGALLVALMNARPQGLLGSARVEIV
jgi:ABC-type branched-subunit amino acid transport system permease subunit